VNIVLIGPTHPFRGGIAHYTTLLALHLSEHNALCFLSFRKQYPKRLFPGRSDRDPSEQALTGGAERLLSPLAPWTWWRTARRMAETRPELVIVQWWVPFWAPSLAALAFLARRWTDARVVFVCHNVLPHEGGRWWERFLIRLALARADAWILHSDRDEAALRALLPHHVARREAASPGGRAIHRALLPLHTISEPIDRDRARRRLNLPAAAPVALFFGFVRPYKGLIHLIDALPALRARLPELRLLVAGEFWEPAEGYLERARALGQAEHIQIDDRYIPNEDVGAYFAAADVLVMPYIQATQSGVVTLAIEHGLPIVATRVGGLPESVEDGRTGLIVPPVDPAALAEAILAVLCDTPLRARLAAGAVAARERFGWRPLVALLEAIGAGEVPGAKDAKSVKADGAAGDGMPVAAPVLDVDDERAHDGP
jgi:glycosyltransferase involved in cell wall biosynthesis